MSWKGALTDKEHPSAMAGMWELLGWSPSLSSAGIAGKYLLDIDLDFFTYGWDRYTFPYNEEIYKGEFLRQCNSRFRKTTAAEFIWELAANAGLVTMAAEPHFCGGISKANTIFTDMNHILFEGQIPEGLMLDYPPVYQSEE